MKQKNFPIIGAKYRDWEVIDDKSYKVSSNRATYWKVKCKCGYEGLRPSTHLLQLRTECCKSCAKRKNTFEQSYLNRIKIRAEKSGFDFDIDTNYIITLLSNQGNKCALSGLPIEIRKMWHGQITQTASLDRIDNTKGYVKGNVQWLHKDINNMKHTFIEEYFINLCKKVATKCG